MTPEHKLAEQLEAAKLELSRIRSEHRAMSLAYGKAHEHLASTRKTAQAIKKSIKRNEAGMYWIIDRDLAMHGVSRAMFEAFFGLGTVQLPVAFRFQLFSPKETWVEPETSSRKPPESEEE